MSAEGPREHPSIDDLLDDVAELRSPREGDEPVAEAGDDASPTDRPPSGDDESRIAQSLRWLARIAGSRHGDDDLPRVIGVYELRERLGEGGMGEVFRAAQTSPLRREVALKVIKAGMDSRRVVARFEAERQTLAHLDHPNIAKVHDAGTTENGRPYFVMELVPGLPVTEWCDRKQRTIPERIDLFRTILDAVQHAHHRGVIHRDLKPSNVLVVEDAGSAIPKVIDFGIAKGTELAGTLLTEDGQLLGTPEYMSPEQAAAQPGGVDARTDIFSLGVLLYELLCGQLPIASEALRAEGPFEIPRILRDVPARSLAGALDGADDASAVASARGTTVDELGRALRGDLEWIVQRAMEKDPDRRYASPAEFAADLRRHRNNEPVTAGPPSTMYRLRKFARRNRGLVTGVVTVAALLVAGITATTWQAVRARRAETDARRNAEVAESVNAFLTGMLEQANPHTNPFGREMTVGEMLDEAARRLAPELDGPSDLRAALEQTVGQAYAALDRVDDAQVHLDEAVALRRQSDDPERLRSALRELGLLAERRADPERAHVLALEEVELTTNAFGARSVPAARSLLRLARTHALRNEFAIADSVFDRGWSVLAAVDPSATDVAALRDHASLLLELGRVDQAEVEARRVLAHFETRLGPDHADTAAAMSLLARILAAKGALEEGIVLQRQALLTSERILGPDSREVVLVRNALGESLTNAGHADEALVVLRVAEASALRLFGERATLRAELVRRIGAAQLALDDVAAAESSFREALSILREHEGDAPSLCYPMNDHAVALRRLGRYAEAEPLFVEALDRAKQLYGDEHAFLAVMLSNLATTRANLGRFSAAIASFEEAVAMADATYPTDRPEPDRIRSRYGECLLQAGRAADAVPVLTRARNALRAKVGDEHPWTRDAERWLAQALAED